MSLRNVRLTRLLLAATLGSAGFNACTCEEEPPVGGRPSLIAQFPNGSSLQSDGTSTLVVRLLARNVEANADTSPITLTSNAAGFFVDSGGAETSVTPNADGAAEVTVQCATNEDGRMEMDADNGNAQASFSVTCEPPDGVINIDVRDNDCETLQADGQSRCTVDITVIEDANGVLLPQQGVVQVRVTAVDPAPGDDAVLAQVGEQAAVNAISINTDEEGNASFDFVAPAVAETVTFEVEFEDTVATSAITVEPFDNRAAMTFTPATLNLTGGQPETVTLSVVRADGELAANGRLESLSIVGELAGATIEVAGVEGEELLDVQLDQNGEAQVIVSTPVVTGPAAFTVSAVFEPLPNLDPLVETLVVTANEEGAILLSLSANPPFVRSDGNAAARTTEVTVQFSQGGDVVAGGELVLELPNESLPFIRFADDVDATSLTLTAADFNAEAEAIVAIAAVDRAAPGLPRLVAVGIDADGNRAEEDLRIEVRREPVLQAIVFKSVTPTTPIGVQGGSLPSSAIVEFQLFDDANNPMPNVDVTFTKNNTADPGLTIVPNDISDETGTVLTVLSAGTQPGPVTVVATAVAAVAADGTELVRTAQSQTIPIVGGLASFETSSLACTDSAPAPYIANCSARLVDRFSNNISGQVVQFVAEAAGEEAAATTAAGVAPVAVSGSGLAPLADVLGWSYGAALPSNEDDITGTTFDNLDAQACFDGDSLTSCNLIALCQDTTVQALCPLPPDCIDDALDALAILQSPPTALQFATSAAQRTRIDEYLLKHRACGLPVGCFVGRPTGIDLDVTDGDECPVSLGCTDFTTATPCPQDGVRTVIAATRGAEAFSDVNGDGLFSFDDANSNGRHDLGEAVLGDDFVDMPEPFLDRNDNCFRDDLTSSVRFSTVPIFKVVNTDQFSDVDDNGTFGFGANNDLTNGVWDADTQIFLTDHVLEVKGDIGFQSGDECSNPGGQHTCADGTVSTCQEIAPGQGFAECDTVQLADNDLVTLSFRYFDANENCPVFGSAVTVTVDEFIDLAAGDSDFEYSGGLCGFGEGFTPILPFCSSVPGLVSPVFSVTIEGNCGADDTGVKLAKLVFQLDGPASRQDVVFFFVDCGL